MCYNVTLCVVVAIISYTDIWLYDMVRYTLGMGGNYLQKAQEA
jgi:hypothetical protein